MTTRTVVPLKITYMYVPRILQISEDEQELDNVTCTSDETLKEMCLVKFKERNQ